MPLDYKNNELFLTGDIDHGAWLKQSREKRKSFLGIP